MKKLIIALAVAAALFMCPSCRKVTGEGPVQSELRDIGGFHGISSAIGGRLNYSIGPTFKVEIIAQRTVLDVLETSVVNGHLLIKARDGIRIKSKEDIVVNITAPTADYIEVSGSGQLQVSGNLVSTKLEMKISDSGNIFVDSLDISGQIEAAVSGSGNINVRAGNVREENLRISGSGKIIMDRLEGQQAIATISGSGNMQLKLSQSLEATISGSGSVYYRGAPRVNAHISGSGRVTPM